MDYARSMEGVEIGALVEERSGQLKGVWRAKDACYREGFISC